MFFWIYSVYLISYLLQNKVFRKFLIFSFNKPNCSSIISHSSSTKYLKLSGFKYPFSIKARILPGVPTIMWGCSFLRAVCWSSKETPPYKALDLISMNLPNLTNSWLTLWASSLVAQRTKAEIDSSFFGNCCKIPIIKPEVLPIPDLAWHRMSQPRMAQGINSFWTVVKNNESYYHIIGTNYLLTGFQILIQIMIFGSRAWESNHQIRWNVKKFCF